MNLIRCPKCNTTHIKRNGYTRHGRLRYKCKLCHHQFSDKATNKVISEEDKKKINRLLLERLSLRGICRVMDVSMPWLLSYISQLYASVPQHLYIITDDTDFEDWADDRFDAMIYDFLEKKGFLNQK